MSIYFIYIQRTYHNSNLKGKNTKSEILKLSLMYNIHVILENDFRF